MAASLQQSVRDAGMVTDLFEPGVNCYSVATATRVSFLVDGDAYFRAFSQAAALARESIIILAWDFDSRTRLHWNDSSAMPATVGPFLNYLVRRRRSLEVHLLNWDYPMLFGTDREFPMLYGLNWAPHRRVHPRFDNTHPVGASHHQKIVVIDDAIAFVGGLDLTRRRWDTCDHAANEARREVDGDPYPPFHDLMAVVDGDAAKALGVLARERWQFATGETIAKPAAGAGDQWPAELTVDMRDVKVGISRTEPPRKSKGEVREVEKLYLDMIAGARHLIYIENQYFTAHKVGDALAARLAEPNGPEIVLVLRYLSHGWLEENTMHALRTRLIKQLREADRWGRLKICYPFIPGLKAGTCIDVHSKVMVVDDRWLRIGSANICNRSMGTDTECDLTFDSGGDKEIADVITHFRSGLIAEHLGVEPESVRAKLASGAGMIDTIASFHSSGRTLKEFEDIPEVSPALLKLVAPADPERPVSLDMLVKEFSPEVDRGDSGFVWRGVILIALVFAGLALAWKYTPLSELADAKLIIDFAHSAAERWWLPLVLVMAYLPASLIMFPRPLITLFAVVAFGARLGAAYALTGILITALVLYAVGRMAPRDVVRRFAGPRLNQITDMLRSRGLLAVTLLRTVPVAPFSVGSVVAGAIRIKLWHYVVGTAIGMLPGTFVTTVFGDQFESALQDPSQVNYWYLGLILLFFAVGLWVVRRVLWHPPAAHDGAGKPQPN